MPKIQYTFKRYEKKYLLTEEQYKILVVQLQRWMSMDEYGDHTICNIYYDTNTYDLIRASIEKPPYKEKFRLRSYGVPDETGRVFAEIKKKFDGVVYKRRVEATPFEIRNFLKGAVLPGNDEQIQREIHWFLHKYDLAPKVFIGYDRIALVGTEDPELRITFDRNIRWRTSRLELTAGSDGRLVLPDNKIVMEIKLNQAAPLWLAALLSELRVYSTGFSKYGVCYQRYLAAEQFTERKKIVC